MPYNQIIYLQIVAYQLKNQCRLTILIQSVQFRNFIYIWQVMKPDLNIV